MMITNKFGTEINVDAAVSLMDDELREQIAGTVDTDQEFFDAYCAAHEKKFCEPFECAKENPCW